MKKDYVYFPQKLKIKTQIATSPSSSYQHLN